MRNANGTGGITKMKGNLRKPYRVRVTTGWKYVDQKGKEVIVSGKPDLKGVRAIQQYKTIGYYATQKEARQALMEWNNDPATFNHMTLEEVYNKMYEERSQVVASATLRSYRTSYKHCARYYKREMSSMKLSDYEELLGPLSPTMQMQTKSLLSLMNEWALKHDVISRNYIQYIRTAKAKTMIEREVITMDEVKLIENEVLRDFVMIGIYTGLRPSEILNIKADKVDGFMLHDVGIKNKTSKERRVPIHPAIKDIIAKYPNGFNRATRTINTDFHMIGHRPHDVRHTFATRAFECNLNPVMVKIIMGHALRDITLGTYTHITDQMLYDEMCKLSYD